MTWVCWSWDRLAWYRKGGDGRWTNDFSEVARMSRNAKDAHQDKRPTENLLYLTWKHANDNGRPLYHTYRGQVD